MDPVRQDDTMSGGDDTGEVHRLMGHLHVVWPLSGAQSYVNGASGCLRESGKPLKLSKFISFGLVSSEDRGLVGSYKSGCPHGGGVSEVTRRDR